MKSHELWGCHFASGINLFCDETRLHYYFAISFASRYGPQIGRRNSFRKGSWSGIDKRCATYREVRSHNAVSRECCRDTSRGCQQSVCQSPRLSRQVDSSLRTGQNHDLTQVDIEAATGDARHNSDSATLPTECPNGDTGAALLPLKRSTSSAG
jgi:hypothetical protein